MSAAAKIQRGNEVRQARRQKRTYAAVRGARGWGKILDTFTVKREAERFAARAALAPGVQVVSVWTLAEKQTSRTRLDLEERVSNSALTDRIGFNSRLRVTKSS